MFQRIKGPQEGSLVCFCLAIAALAHRGLPLGAYSDLYLPWYGARALLLERRNPYTDAVTHQIQVGYFEGLGHFSWSQNGGTLRCRGSHLGRKRGGHAHDVAVC